MTSRPKSSLQLYRDCMRLVKHIAGAGSPKTALLMNIVKTQFRHNKDEADQQKVHKMKQAAERCLSNYFLFEKTQTDPKLKEAARQNFDLRGWDLEKMMQPDENDPDYDVEALDGEGVEGEGGDGGEEAEEAEVSGVLMGAAHGSEDAKA